MTFAFIRQPETRANCQRILLLADLREARDKHKPTARIICAVKQATQTAMRLEIERKRR